MFPAITRATESRLISMRKLNASEATVAKTMFSRGNHTFLTRPPLARSDAIAPFVAWATKFQGRRAQSRKNAKSLRPLAIGAGACWPRNFPNTIVYTTIVANGLSIDHAQPSVERLYFPRNSRSVRFQRSSREEVRSATRTKVPGVGSPPL